MPAVIRPAMSDGRSLTNWMSTCEFENNLKQNFSIGSESQYRSMLQSNAKAFADRSKQYAEFTPYYATSSCPQAADAHMAMVNAFSKNR